MSNSIKISPKHGLNPSIIKCFWCGENSGLALLGRIENDEKAPAEIIESYEPCEKCKETFAQGILAIGVQDTPLREGFPPIQKTDDGTLLYPDGSHVLFTEDGIRHFLDDQVIIEEAIKHKAIFMPKDIVYQIVQNVNEIKEEESQHENDKSGVSTN